MNGERRNRKPFLFSQLCNIILNVIQVLILLHIFLVLFKANRVPFVNWMLSLSAPFLRPFKGIFSRVSLKGDMPLDLSAVFALIIYSIAGYILIRLVMLIEKR